MNFTTRLMIVMWTRLADFLRAFPLADEPADQVVARFMEKLERAQFLAGLHEEGKVTRKAETRRHKSVRARMVRYPLRHVAAVATSLDLEHASVADALMQTTRKMPAPLFIATARSIEATVKEQHDLLRKNGMAEGTQEELSSLVVEYEQAVSDANAGLRAHTGARAELRTLRKELKQLVKQLDGIVVYRFRDNPDRLGAWVSARNVAWPTGEPAKKPVALKPPVNV